MDLDHSMNDWNFSAICVEYDDVSCSDGCAGLVEEENVAAIEAWFHAATENDNDRGFAAGDDDEEFPDHEC